MGQSVPLRVTVMERSGGVGLWGLWVGDERERLVEISDAVEYRKDGS